MAVAFDNQGRAVTLNFVLVKRADGWVITEVDSPHDSVHMFLDGSRTERYATGASVGADDANQPPEAPGQPGARGRPSPRHPLSR